MPTALQASRYPETTGDSSSIASTSTQALGGPTALWARRRSTRLIRRSTRPRVIASPLSSSNSKGKSRDSGEPQYLPLGPPDLEALYADAVADLKKATRDAFYALCPREYLIHPLDSPEVKKRKRSMWPGVEDIKKAGFADVDKTRRRVGEIDKLLDQAIEKRKLTQGGDGGWPEDKGTSEVNVKVDTEEEDRALAREFLSEMAKWKRQEVIEKNTITTAEGFSNGLTLSCEGAGMAKHSTEEGSSGKRRRRDVGVNVASTNLQDIDQNSPPRKRYRTRRETRLAQEAASKQQGNYFRDD